MAKFEGGPYNLEAYDASRERRIQGSGLSFTPKGQYNLMVEYDDERAFRFNSVLHTARWIGPGFHFLSLSVEDPNGKGSEWSPRMRTISHDGVIGQRGLIKNRVISGMSEEAPLSAHLYPVESEASASVELSPDGVDSTVESLQELFLAHEVQQAQQANQAGSGNPVYVPRVAMVGGVIPIIVPRLHQPPRG